MRTASPPPHRASLVTADIRTSAALRSNLERRPRLARLCAILAHAGDGLVCYLALAITALLAEPARPTVWRMVIATLLAAGAVALGKVAFGRPRPMPEESRRWSSLGRHDDHAFPSGHAARTAAIASVAWGVSPAAGAALTAWSLAVSLCRVSLGAHYFGDVIVGTVVGVLAALVLRWMGWL